MQHQLSQEALAVDADIDRTYVSRLERGLENPTVGLLEKVAIALEIDIGEFFIEPEEGANPPEPLPKGRKPKK